VRDATWHRAGLPGPSHLTRRHRRPAPWRDSTTQQVISRLEFIQRMAALVRKPLAGRPSHHRSSGPVVGM